MKAAWLHMSVTPPEAERLGKEEIQGEDSSLTCWAPPSALPLRSCPAPLLWQTPSAILRGESSLRGLPATASCSVLTTPPSCCVRQVLDTGPDRAAVSAGSVQAFEPSL